VQPPACPLRPQTCRIPDNVIVASGSGANSEAVADMALALALSALKFIPFYQNEMKMESMEKTR